MQENIDTRRIVIIEKTILETSTVKTLVFRDKMSANSEPGQFLMVWIPRVEEIPMSVMINQKLDNATITVRKQGMGSTALFNKEQGESIGIRGPYGNKFTISNKSKKILLIGGGTGLVPLLRLSKDLNEKRINCTIIIGARSKNEVFFEDIAKNTLKNVKHSIIVSTDDGSYGLKGTAVDVFKQLIKGEKFDCIYTCGPEPMMKKIFEFARSRCIPIQASLERYMKCGIGLCGSCCMDGLLICRDGTIFDDMKLSEVKDFGYFYRDKDGRIKRI